MKSARIAGIAAVTGANAGPASDPADRAVIVRVRAGDRDADRVKVRDLDRDSSASAATVADLGAKAVTAVREIAISADLVATNVSARNRRHRCRRSTSHSFLKMRALNRWPDR